MEETLHQTRQDRIERGVRGTGVERVVDGEDQVALVERDLDEQQLEVDLVAAPQQLQLTRLAARLVITGDLPPAEDPEGRLVLGGMDEQGIALEPHLEVAVGIDRAVEYGRLEGVTQSLRERVHVVHGPEHAPNRARDVDRALRHTACCD